MPDDHTPTRYHMTDMRSPELSGCLLMSVPQNADQLGTPVLKLFEMPWVKRVVIFYDHGQGEKATAYARMPKEQS